MAMSETHIVVGMKSSGNLLHVFSIEEKEGEEGRHLSVIHQGRAEGSKRLQELNIIQIIDDRTFVAAGEAHVYV